MGLSSGSLPNGRLFIRSLFPSVIGFMLYVFFALLFLSMHLLMLSLSGKAFPLNINDVLLDGYTNYIVGPLIMAMNSSVVNNGLWLLLWGTLGFAVYELLAFAVKQLEDWRATRQAVMFPDASTAARPVRHFMVDGSVVVHLFWRIFVVLLGIVYTIVVLPVVHFCLVNNEKILAASELLPASKLFGLGLLAIVAVLHGYAVLIRWYLFRTRITGEIIY